MSLVLIQFAIVAGMIMTASMVLALLESMVDRKGRQVRIAAAYTLGFLAGGFVAWQLLTLGWPLSFGTTMKASVNAAAYGHAVEHTAENILVGVLVFAVIGGVLFTLTDVLAAKLISRTKHA